MSTIVTLTTSEVRICTMLGMERWFEKKGSQDRPGYAIGKAAGALEHELLANVRANVAEYAVAKHFAQPWTVPWYPNEEHKQRKDHPDVGRNIEVRVVRTKNAVPVWDKDINKQAIIVGCKVIDDEHFTEVEIFGWFPAIEAQRPEWLDKLGAYRIPIGEFNTHGT